MNVYFCYNANFSKIPHSHKFFNPSEIYNLNYLRHTMMRSEDAARHVDGFGVEEQARRIVTC